MNSQTAFPPVHAVLFDYGMVLSGAPDPTAWQTMRELTGLDEDAFHAAYWSPRHAYDEGLLSGRAYWAGIAGVAPAGPIVDQLIAADIALWTQPNQPMIDWALALQRAGVRTGILSNIGDEMERGIVATFPWLSGFHHRTWSHRLKLAKPDLAIYAHAAAGLETPPSNILFLDDREDNIAAAARAGMQAIRYTTHAAFEQAMHEQGRSHLLAARPAMA